jgi:hypothetical protein
VSGNTAIRGGGIYATYFGSARLINSVVSRNGGISGAGISKGGSGKLVVDRSTISGNIARNGGSGGGIDVAGDFAITNSTISGNSVTGRYASGGGIDVGGSNYLVVTITNTTISGNSAIGQDSGCGGISSINGYLTVVNSTISGNSVSGTGSHGGGVCNNSVDGTMTITNSTITRNLSGGRGGGVYNERPLDLNRTLISGNTASGAGSELYNSNYGSVSAANFNLFGHSGLTNARAFRNFTPGATDITATSNGNRPTALSAVLNTNLANNGGPTDTCFGCGQSCDRRGDQWHLPAASHRPARRDKTAGR